MSSDAARRGYRSQDPLSAHRMMELGLPPRRARPGPRVCGPCWALCAVAQSGLLRRPHCRRPASPLPALSASRELPLGQTLIPEDEVENPRR